jgi:hypothetical protein
MPVNVQRSSKWSRAPPCVFWLKYHPLLFTSNPWQVWNKWHIHRNLIILKFYMLTKHPSPRVCYHLRSLSCCSRSDIWCMRSEFVYHIPFAWWCNPWSSVHTMIHGTYYSPIQGLRYGNDSVAKEYCSLLGRWSYTWKADMKPNSLKYIPCWQGKLHL